MANATVNVAPQKLELTPQRVNWNGIDLGATLDSVKIEIKTMKAPVNADQYGKTVLDNRLNGYEFKVTTSLAQVRDPQFWSYVFPSATFTTGTLIFQQNTGRSDRDNAHPLILHPIVMPDGDLTQDHTFYLAHPTEESGIEYGPEKQAKLNLVFSIYPQILTGGGGVLQFYKFGT